VADLRKKVIRFIQFVVIQYQFIFSFYSSSRYDEDQQAQQAQQICLHQCWRPRLIIFFVIWLLILFLIYLATISLKDVMIFVYCFSAFFSFLSYLLRHLLSMSSQSTRVFYQVLIIFYKTQSLPEDEFFDVQLCRLIHSFSFILSEVIKLIKIFLLVAHLPFILSYVISMRCVNFPNSLFYINV